MARIDFDRYYRFEELSGVLHWLAAEFPRLIELTSVGKSYEGREIWLLTLTDRETGPADEKPAFWCDGNIHASEVSASSAVLMVAAKLLGLAGDGGPNPILATHSFYLAPRLNPDGAEWALEVPPRIVRSSTRPYPWDEEDPYGLERKDLDGDGRILSMRVPDENGAWIASELDSRLLRRRRPGEAAERAYRLIPEGVFHNFDGLTMRPRRLPQGLDANRNFPYNFRLEHEQKGAGPFPTSEPEIRAAVEAIVARPNICGAITFHTYSGVHLRPPSDKPDDSLPPEDLWTFEKLGRKGTELTGYPTISNYHEFRYHPKEVITGVFDAWMYEHRGVHCWTTEIWSPQRQAGITEYKYIDWFREHPEDDDLKLLRWSDERLGGRAFEPWRPFDHPQLGAVEIGGWDFAYAFRNPPPELLEAEVGPLAEWAIWHAGTSPRLRPRALRVEPVGGAWRIRFAVQNAGWLPTSVTKIAEERKLTRGVVGEIERVGAEAEEATWLAAGKLREVGPHLKGWSHVSAAGFGQGFDATEDVHVFEWVVAQPGRYRLTARSERAGVLRETVDVA